MIYLFFEIIFKENRHNKNRNAQNQNDNSQSRYDKKVYLTNIDWDEIFEIFLLK